MAVIDYSKHHFCTYCRTRYPLDVWKCTNKECSRYNYRIRSTARQKTELRRMRAKKQRDAERAFYAKYSKNITEFDKMLKNHHRKNILLSKFSTIKKKLGIEDEQVSVL